MIITRLKACGKRLVIEFDEGPSLLIAQDVALKFILYKGKDLNDEDVAAILNEQEFFDAISAAHRFIGYRARSEREVREKLRTKKISATTIERAIALLRHDGTLDDSDFSWKFVHDAQLRKPVGRIRLKQELRRKGMDDAMIERALDLEFTGAQEIDAARTLTAKRRRTRAEEHPAALAQYLYSRGFSREAISAAVGNGEGE